MPDNAADRKGIRRREKAALIADIQRRDVITMLMSTSQGRHWLWDKLGECHIFHTTFNGDALQSAFAEGQRSVGLSLLADIMFHCPDQYIQAQRESNERHISNNRNPDDSGLADTAAPAERFSGAQPDGGDSGAEPDRSGSETRDAEVAGWNPGSDIYVPGPEAR